MKSYNYKAETILLYKSLGWKSMFSKIRFWDAHLVELENYIPKKSTIVDLGCGDGIFTNYLALTSRNRKIFGFDIDNQRLQIANRGIKNVSYARANILNLNIPLCDTIILFHVLHHLPSHNAQEKIINHCKKSLRKNGKMFVLEIDVSFKLGYLIGWFADHFLVPIFFEKRFFSKIYFRKKNQWKDLFEKKGFKCNILKLNKNFPVANILLECTKL